MCVVFYFHPNIKNINGKEQLTCHQVCSFHDMMYKTQVGNMHVYVVVVLPCNHHPDQNAFHLNVNIFFVFFGIRTTNQMNSLFK